jgi:hypothetical protein
MEVDMEADHEKTEVKMYKEAQTPLYEGCPSYVLLDEENKVFL